MRRRLTIHLLAAISLLLLSCNLLLGGVDQSSQVDATISALHTQQASLDKTVTALSALASSTGDPGPAAQATLDASLATSTAQSQLVATLEAPQESPIPTASLTEPEDRLLKSARILLFEDMSASRFIRIAKEALDQSGYFYQDVGSAKGWFKTQLLSSVKWDLIIAAAEADREFGGEFFEYIDNRVADGAAAIVESWDFDLAPNGKAGALLQRCGLRYQSDWNDPQSRAIFWLIQDHPVLNQPNRIGALHNSQRIWLGDLGDLFESGAAVSGAGSQPELLAGTSPSLKNSHALLVSCLDGRLIIQSFRTHEYQYEEMLMLWKNYIYQALKSYFEDNGKLAPTPQRTAEYQPLVTPTSHGPTPGPEYLFDHACAGFFTLRFRSSPQFQQDLFEHHAQGTYLVLHIRMQNTADFPIMVWDKDYFVEGSLGERSVLYSQNSAATGYLFLDREGHLVQGVIEPGEQWDVSLAFDIDPQARDLDFVFRPGSKFQEQVCEVRVPVYR